MLIEIILVIGLVVVLMLARIPIGFAFGMGGIVLMLLSGINPQITVPTAFRLLLSFVFLALPLYLLLGAAAGSAGIADKISNFVVSAIGRLRGGLGVAVIITNGVFGAISGVAMSALAGIGKSFLPSMEREGYPIWYTAALLVASAVLALMIPPSGTMIIYGFMARLPISLCFLAPFIPGVILIFFLSVVNLWMARSVPSIHVPAKLSFKADMSRMVKTGYRATFALLLPLIVLGGIYGGLYTPTEAAALGVFYALIVGLVIYRTLTIKSIAGDMVQTGITIGSIVALFFFFIVISKIFILERTSDQILALMMMVSTNKWVLMAMLNILMLIMGMIIDDASAMMIAAIMLLPIAQSIGFDPYHFAGIACLNLGMGLITPPVAPLLYLAEVITGAPLHTYVRPVFYYIVFAYLPTLAITIAFPILSTYLPYLVARVV